jgi:soluble P-type ATPase
MTREDFIESVCEIMFDSMIDQGNKIFITNNDRSFSKEVDINLLNELKENLNIQKENSFKDLPDEIKNKIIYELGRRVNLEIFT